MLFNMQGRGLSLMCLTLCYLHMTTDSQHVTDDYSGKEVNEPMNRGKDGLAISREIFRNITKKLRENFKSEVIVNVNKNKMQVKPDEKRNFTRYQGYHHHEQHWGPYFEEDNVTQVVAHVGSEALLNCRIFMLKDKTVMWLRNTSDAAQLLTVGKEVHTGDKRLSVKFQYPNNWRMSINPVRKSDEGLFMCQISTHPPRTVYTNLTVLAAILTINGDSMQIEKDRFYKAGSSIKLNCVISEEYARSMENRKQVKQTTVKNTTPETTTPESTTEMTTVYNRLEIILNRSWSIGTTTITSTVSISKTTTKIPEYQKTTLSITPSVTPEPVHNIYGLLWKKHGKEYNEHITWRNISATITIMSASQEDSGLYTCLLKDHSQVTTNVHVLIGENQAAVHHDTWNKGSLYWQPYNRPIALLLLVLIVA